ncbi:MAG: hypothetical protein EOP04_12200 [Proteobacteria bacterium]|nr:MAG: hypothetical protein EOP04_12200 [Pseudomonadota bacterium]
MPGDNELQKILATRLRKGVALSPFYGEWQASDRPPLLSGFYLLFTWNNEPIFYRALAFAVQLLWVPAVVVFALSLRQSRSLIAWALLGISLNGFVLLNSVYTWPKMQSAAYFIFGLSVLTERFNYASNRSRGILSGVSFGLSFISHAGIVFTAPVVLSLFFFQKMTWEQLSSKLRTIGFSIVLFVLVFIPWRLFQVFVDPPGDQILKLHIFNRTDRLPMSQLFLEVYGKLTLNEWIVLRVENFKNLIGDFRWPWQVSLGEEFAYLTHGLGLVDVIIPAAVCGLYLFARGRRIAALGMVFWGSLISLGLWLCVMLLPIFIGNHLNSYAIYLLLLTGAYLTIGKAARVIMPICILMACYRLLSIWVASNPNGGSLDLAQLGILGGALVWMIFVIHAWSSQVKYLELS